MGFFTILTLIFIVLKLTNVIIWSWLLVLSPMIILIIFNILMGTVGLALFKKYLKKYK